jgi:hypothetical protein
MLLMLLLPLLLSLLLSILLAFRPLRFFTPFRTTYSCAWLCHMPCSKSVELAAAACATEEAVLKAEPYAATAKLEANLPTAAVKRPPPPPPTDDDDDDDDDDDNAGDWPSSP